MKTRLRQTITPPVTIKAADIRPTRNCQVGLNDGRLLVILGSGELHIHGSYKHAAAPVQKIVRDLTEHLTKNLLVPGGWSRAYRVGDAVNKLPPLT